MFLLLTFCEHCILHLTILSSVSRLTHLINASILKGPPLKSEVAASSILIIKYSFEIKLWPVAASNLHVVFHLEKLYSFLQLFSTLLKMFLSSKMGRENHKTLKREEKPDKDKLWKFSGSKSGNS